MTIKIKDLPLNDRPRERLITKGAKNLSNEELLAIILKTGTKDTSAKNLAAQLLKYLGKITNLKHITYHELLQIKGIGEAKACQLLSCVELAKRINQQIETLQGQKFTNPKLIFDYYKNIVSHEQESFYCVYLNVSKQIIMDKKIFMGTLNKSLIHPRDIFRVAYILNAHSFICIHNHPSGSSKPSKEDEIITGRLKWIGNIMGIPLVDHVIIGKQKYYSFLENNKI